MRPIATPGVLASPPVADTTPSVAVLPFVYLGSDTTQAYAANAIADAITNALALERGLRVSSRSAAEVLQRRIASGDTTRIPVRTLVEGVVEVEGTRVRLTVRLRSCQRWIHALCRPGGRRTGQSFCPRRRHCERHARSAPIAL